MKNRQREWESENEKDRDWKSKKMKEWYSEKLKDWKRALKSQSKKRGSKRMR